MSASGRRERLVQLVNASGECAVAQLARRFGVSEMTVRRDLQALGDAGRIIRTHGGARPAERISFEFKFLERAQRHRPAKQAIARAAARLVADGQSVMLDSGTTTLAIAEALRAKRGISVVTTSLPIASALQFRDDIGVLLLGGLLRRESPDLMGPLTEQNIEQLRVDIAFLGADGIDLEGNVYNAAAGVALILAKMAASAQRVYIVADSSKCGRTALMRFGCLTDWDGLITDRALPAGSLKALHRVKVNVIRAG